VVLLAQRGQHGQAVDARQHAVQQHQVVGALAGLVQAVDAVAHQVDDEALLREAAAQVFAELVLVLDDEQFHRRPPWQVVGSRGPGSGV